MMNMFRFLCVLGLIAIVNVEGAPITGPNCVSSCSGRPDGDYQSCNGCNVYVTCFGGGFIIDNRPCAVSTLVWDDNVKRCEYTSNTCSEPAITCQQPATIAHASMDPVKQEYNQDDTVTYTCDPGYSGSGDTVVTCSDIGVWSATALVCQLSDSCTAITTPNAYSYVDIAEIDGNIPFTFTFKVKACNDVHVGFYAASSDAEVYEIVIAGWGNSQSVIRTQKQGTNHVTVAGARLSCSEFRGFWISYDDGHIKVGEGNVVGNNEFMSYDHPSPYSGIKLIGISTGFGASGEWCYDSCTAITTPNAYSYVDIEEIDGSLPFTFTFKVKACNDVHVGFYAASSDADVYEIVIAGWGNSQSVIRTQKQGTNHVTVAGARLSCSEFRGFWISYNDGHIKVGEGNVVGNHEFMNYDHSSPYSGIAWIGITTGFGATGEWCFYGAQQ